MDDPRRILLVRPSALGDVCRSVPVLTSLKARFPEARIDWVVQDTFAPAVAAHPDLTSVVPFPRSRFGRAWRSPQTMREFVAWTRTLRDAAYDLVFDCQGLGRSGFMTRATAAPRRVGFRDARELGWLGYTVRHDVPAGLHAVDRMLALLGAEGIPVVRNMRLYVPAAGRQWFERLQRRLGIDGPYAVLAPTARWSGKRWPAERWSEIVPPLLERGFGRVILIGAPSERAQVEACVPQGAPRRAVVNLVGRTSLEQTLALVARSELVIGNDSAPLHMAVGFDRRLIGLFGPTDPARVGPYGREPWVVRAPLTDADIGVSFKDAKAGDSIMRRIATADVLSRLDRVLAEVPLNRGTGSDTENAPGVHSTSRVIPVPGAIRDAP
ncbi:MAG: lipopolysaccharide heptosyltransferase I [Phycisphaerales bacterium]|nr:lipopolysaccharide heptosyltransferase I [Phycisphaerales bacterium]